MFCNYLVLSLDISHDYVFINAKVFLDPKKKENELRILMKEYDKIPINYG